MISFHAKQNLPSSGYLPKLRTFFPVDIWFFWKKTFKPLHPGFMGSHHRAKWTSMGQSASWRGQMIVDGCKATYVRNSM